MMQPMFPPPSGQELSRRLKIFSRTGQGLTSMELQAVLQSAGRTPLYRAEILKVFSAAFACTAPADLQEHCVLIASLQQTLQMGYIQEDIETAIVYAEIVLCWVVQAPAPVCLLERYGPVDAALGHLSLLISSLSALQGALDQSQQPADRTRLAQFIIEFLSADIRRACTGCVAVVQARHTFVAIFALRCLSCSADSASAAAETASLAALMCELVWLASSVRADIGSSRGGSKPNSSKGSSRKRQKRGQLCRVSAWRGSRGDDIAARDGSASDKSSSTSESDSDSDMSMGAAQEQRKGSVASDPSGHPLLAAARSFAMALALNRRKHSSRSDSSNNSSSAIPVLGQLSAAVELMLVPEVHRWPLSLLRHLCAQLSGLALILAAKLPRLPQPLWAGRGAGVRERAVTGDLPAVTDASEFLKRGRRWHALRRLLVRSTAGNAEAARVVVAALLAPVQQCARAIAARSLTGKRCPTSPPPTCTTTCSTCGQLLCCLEAAVSYASHLRGSRAEHAALAIQELVALVHELFAAASTARGGEEEDMLDCSTLPSPGSAQDNEASCAIRLIVAAVGYLVVHRLPLVVCRQSLIDALGSLLGPKASDASRLALLTLLHPAIALYIVAYALPHLGVFTDRELLLAAAPLAAAEAGKDFLRLDMSAAFGEGCGEDHRTSSFSKDRCCVSQWLPEQEEEWTSDGAVSASVPAPAPARIVNMANLHLLTSSDLVRMRLSLAASFPATLATSDSSAGAGGGSGSSSGSLWQSHAAQIAGAGGRSVFIFPEGVLYAILEFLSARQLCRSAQASKALRSLALSGRLWYELFRARFPTTFFAGREGEGVSRAELLISAGAGRANVRAAERKPLFVPKPVKVKEPAARATAHSAAVAALLAQVASDHATSAITASTSPVPAQPLSASAYVFNRIGACPNCYGPSGITSGSGAVAAAAAQLSRTPLLPLPLRRKQSLSCSSDDVRHDWRSLFKARWLAIQEAKKKQLQVANRARSGGEAASGGDRPTVRVSVCAVVGCSFLFKDKEVLSAHMAKCHPLLHGLRRHRRAAQDRD